MLSVQTAYPLRLSCLWNRQQASSFEKNPHEQRPCASVTKVMTLLLVFEAVDSGKLSLDDEITASEHAAGMGGSDIWLEKGETMSADDMIKAQRLLYLPMMRRLCLREHIMWEVRMLLLKNEQPCQRARNERHRFSKTVTDLMRRGI